MNSSIAPGDRRQKLEGEFARLGLVVVGWVNLADLPANWWRGDGRPSRGSLLVIGNVGGAFWRSVRSTEHFTGSHPLDNASAAVTASILDNHLACDRRLLYPDAESTNVNLLAVMDALRWQQPSPLGLGIHATYGLWHAVRVA